MLGGMSTQLCPFELEDFGDDGVGQRVTQRNRGRDAKATCLELSWADVLYLDLDFNISILTALQGLIFQGRSMLHSVQISAYRFQLDWHCCRSTHLHTYLMMDRRRKRRRQERRTKSEIKNDFASMSLSTAMRLIIQATKMAASELLHNSNTISSAVEVLRQALRYIANLYRSLSIGQNIYESLYRQALDLKKRLDDVAEDVAEDVNSRGDRLE